MKNDNFKIRFGLTPKLFVLVLLSFGLLMAVIVWRIGVEANLVANTAIEKSLQQSGLILETTLATRFKRIEETAQSLARDGRILPRIYEGDSATLQDLTSEFQQTLAFDILFFIDADGVILARSDKPQSIGKSVGKRHLFDTALQGKITTGMMISKGNILQIVAVPIRDNVAKDVIRGVVALAYPLAAEIAADINQLTASEIGFFAYGRKDRKPTTPTHRFMTTDSVGTMLDNYFAQQPEIWQKILDHPAKQHDLVVQFNDDIYHTVIYPLLSSGGTQLGFITAVRARSELTKPFTAIQRQVLLVGGACLIMASLMAWGLAGRIARPIIKLAAITNDIQNGEFSGGQPDYTSHDEVGVLYRSVYRMGKELKDKADLESYLAQLSNALDDDLMFSDDPIASVEASLKEMSTPDLEQTLVTSEVEQTLVTTENEQTIALDDEKTMVTASADEPISDVGIAANSLLPGDIFAERYQILKALGTGAMGIVYMAKDVELDEAVALKIIFTAGLEGDELDQFKQEIRLARRITHRNILRTFDFGTSNQLHFITMEFIHGFDLNELIRKKGKLEPHIALLMARQICSAIAAAHEEGIIHRDLKPQNMMINRQGILKIMDFGLAMTVAKPAYEGADVETGTDMTQQSGGIAGTPNYMSPEQFQGEELDVRSDIYAIGIILYKMFSGATPYTGRTFEALAKKHLYDPIPTLSNAVQGIPIELDNIVSKAIAKDKNERFSSINELQAALQNISV